MAENSKIEWTDHTFNPWVGCTKVSPACDNCYAEGWAKRTGQANLWAGDRRRTSHANWDKPLKWNTAAVKAGKPVKVFCASLADVFDNQIPEQWRTDLFDVIRQTPYIHWQLLTKRPQNIAKMLPPDWGDGYHNVWLGTTAEDQQRYDQRRLHLLGVPAVVHFFSVEPMLGPIVRDLANERGRTVWYICGGESGPRKRPMDLSWARGLRDQCLETGTPFFMKQIDKVQPIPDDLMVRQFPTSRRDGA